MRITQLMYKEKSNAHCTWIVSAFTVTCEQNLCPLAVNSPEVDNYFRDPMALALFSTLE